MKSFTPSELFDIYSLKHGLRRASTLNIPRVFFEECSSFLSDLGIQFKVVRWVKQYDGLSLSHTISNKNDLRASAYCVLYLREEDAVSFIDATKSSNHKTIGQLLGFPDCCIESFCKRTLNFDQDFVLFQTENSNYTEEMTELPNGIKHRNITLIDVLPSCASFFRYWDLRQSFHAPCRFDCTETHELFLKQLPLMRELSEERLNLILDLVNHPIVWSGYKQSRVVYANQFQKTFHTVYLNDFTTVNYFPNIKYFELLL